MSTPSALHPTLAAPAEMPPRRSLRRYWFVPPWIAFLLYQWWVLIEVQIRDAIPAPTASALGGRLALLVALGAVARVLGTAIEAGVYALVWRSWGRQLGFLRTAFWLLTISSLDVLASQLRFVGLEHGDMLAAWLAPVVGCAVLPEPRLEGGLLSAFGTFGLLAIARLVATARAQAALLRIGMLRPLALTAGMWLVTHVALWWSVDLMGGRSTLP
jgi:hypothetical protein